MARYSVGIYWDNVSLSACLVRVGATEHTVERIVSMPREYDEAYVPRKHISEELSQLLASAFTDPSDTFVAALPERETMHRTLSRPFGDRKKISLTIAPEVETLLPVPDGNIIVDYVLLGKDDSGLHQIATVSATHKVVQKVITEVGGAGIDPEIVDSPQTALLAGARGVFRPKEDATTLILHMGWQETSLAVLMGRDVKHIGAFPYGFERIALAAFKGKAASPSELKEALAQGVTAGSLLDPCIREVLITLSRIGASEHSFILVPTGYARSVKDLPDRFGEAAGIAVELPPQGGVHSGVEMDELLNGFMPVSLALRGIDGTDRVNFRKKDLAYTKKIEWIKGYTGTWPKVAAVLVALWVAGLVVNISLNARVNHQLSTRIKTEFNSVMPPGTPMVEPVKQMEQLLARLSPQSGSASSGGGITPLEILRDISVNIPASIDVLVDTISIEDSSITITGFTSSYDNVEKMKTGLSALPYAGEVKIVSANADKNDQRIRLKLVCSKKSSS